MTGARVVADILLDAIPDECPDLRFEDISSVLIIWSAAGVTFGVVIVQISGCRVAAIDIVAPGSTS